MGLPTRVLLVLVALFHLCQGPVLQEQAVLCPSGAVLPQEVLAEMLLWLLVQALRALVGRFL